jgi:hypothetical protein
VLLQRGLVLEQSLRYRLAYGDAHNEGAWRRRMPDCLEFLGDFSKRISLFRRLELG